MPSLLLFLYIQYTLLLILEFICGNKMHLPNTVDMWGFRHVASFITNNINIKITVYNGNSIFFNK